MMKFNTFQQIQYSTCPRPLLRGLSHGIFIERIHLAESMVALGASRTLLISSANIRLVWTFCWGRSTQVLKNYFTCGAEPRLLDPNKSRYKPDPRSQFPNQQPPRQCRQQKMESLCLRILCNPPGVQPIVQHGHTTTGPWKF